MLGGRVLWNTLGLQSTHCGNGFYGKCAIVTNLRKYRINVASSTELVLVCIANILGMILWCKYSIEAQGYIIERNILYQDNKLIILLSKNKRRSDYKNIKHTKNSFFLINVNTKLMQGPVFRKVHHTMMDVPAKYEDAQAKEHTSDATAQHLNREVTHS